MYPFNSGFDLLSISDYHVNRNVGYTGRHMYEAGLVAVCIPMVNIFYFDGFSDAESINKANKRNHTKVGLHYALFKSLISIFFLD